MISRLFRGDIFNYVLSVMILLIYLVRISLQYSPKKIFTLLLNQRLSLVMYYSCLDRLNTGLNFFV